MSKVEQFNPSDLSNATPGFLVDELGLVRERIKALQKQEGFIKAAFKARLEDGQLAQEGDVFIATITPSQRATLDQQAAREALGEDWVLEHTKVTEFDVIRTSRLIKEE